MLIEKNDTEARIFEAARVLFNQWGYTGMTLRQIAKAVGIEVQSLYNYISSKQALVESMVRNGTGELHASVLAALEVAGPAPSARLAAGVKAHVIHYLSSSNVVVFFRDSLVHFDGDVRDSLLVMLKAYEQVFKDIIQEGIDRGEFREVDVTPTTYAILGMSDSVINWWRPGGRLDADAVGGLFGDLAVQMVARPPDDDGALTSTHTRSTRSTDPA
ncbi:TetR/AcrR family transcriptional regulator [Diaminobutyricimonas sp. LJ205]|uniref:TetR/AcrR family transcriptional regulator n=1 Tax=Diaminobutyricimonas sp. LJ205 TaxID=2683590 RepID=UPI0012F4FF11|nr:TetR/AcrR family transcriptional regulator [Diaminobutyricimonas sp. LJ205]